MSASLTLLNLAGNVAMLLWGLYMVKSGIMRALGTDLRRYLGVALRNRFKALFTGFAATALIQSSTAVGLMASSFAASRLVGLVPALAMMLGANIGTTILVQLFTFRLGHVAPILVLIGFIAFRRGKSTRVHDYGRAVIGIGFMLLALEMMMELLRPAEGSQSLKLLLDTIAQDHLLDLLMGALLTWIMHSSVSVVLLSISLATQHVIGLDIAFVLVLGANLGSAINPLLETPSGGNPAARRLPVGNLINRTTGCILFMPFIGVLIDMLPPALKASPAHSVALFHTIFNLTMALLFFPFLSKLAAFLQRVFPERAAMADLSTPLYLDPKAQQTPDLGLASSARETLRMADMVEKMLQGMLELLINNDRKQPQAVRQMGDVIEKLNVQIKYYITSMKMSDFTEEQTSRAHEVLSFALNLEHIGDIVSGSLLKLGSKKIKNRLVFSSEGWADIRDFYEHVIQNVQVASALFMTREVRTAKQLLLSKRQLQELESRANETHFMRLREGRQESIETSSLHLDMLRDLVRINSYLTSGAFRILEKNGVLMPNLLKQE